MAKEKDDVMQADALAQAARDLKAEIAKIIVGQDDVIKLLLISIFCDGHALLVGVPGLAKTMLVQTLSKSLSLASNRIQFTPDLMPSDILGAETMDKDRNLRFVKGPVFANIILADEINRTPPKTQSALLEAMQEKSVTVGGTHYPLDRPFFVLATQNPIEQEGTYPLPEAQLDRFMFMIKLDYPSYDEEMEIVRRTTSGDLPEIKAILSREQISEFQKLIKKVPVTDHVLEYAVTLVTKTRPGTEKSHELATNYLEWGAGPRASQFLIYGAKCHAILSGKYSPDIEDVKAIAPSVLSHRMVRNFKADAEGYSEERIIEGLL
ncbi:MAG: MoxR family ATPase [Cytophagales bacterium]|nr:MoxR family ATPase [Cytophagales bacterium]